jgi:hypothetical protein
MKINKLGHIGGLQVIDFYLECLLLNSPELRDHWILLSTEQMTRLMLEVTKRPQDQVIGSNFWKQTTRLCDLCLWYFRVQLLWEFLWVRRRGELWVVSTLDGDKQKLMALGLWLPHQSLGTTGLLWLVCKTEECIVGETKIEASGLLSKVWSLFELNPKLLPFRPWTWRNRPCQSSTLLETIERGTRKWLRTWGNQELQMCTKRCSKHDS